MNDVKNDEEIPMDDAELEQVRGGSKEASTHLSPALSDIARTERMPQWTGNIYSYSF